MAKNQTPAEKPPERRQMTVAEQRQAEFNTVRAQLTKGEAEFLAALPANIPPDRFNRILLTAVQSNMALLECERSSFFRAALKAAQDGLLPDGREGALVPYKGQVQWLPMVAGLRKKARNSGQILSWDVQIVRARDEFEFELGDEAFIRHRPYIGPDEPGDVIAAYSIAHLKDGGVSREIMSRRDLDKVRKASQSTKGPWFDWFEEMCRKTVARRHSKSLPMSSDLDDLVRSDDYLYDKEGAAEENKRVGRSVRSNLAMLSGGMDASGDDMPAHDPATGEIKQEAERGEPETRTVEREPETDKKTEQKQAEKSASGQGSNIADDFPGDIKTEGPAEKITPEQRAFREGSAARSRGALKRGVPQEYCQPGRETLRAAWEEGWSAVAE